MVNKPTVLAHDSRRRRHEFDSSPSDQDAYFHDERVAAYIRELQIQDQTSRDAQPASFLSPPSPSPSPSPPSYFESVGRQEPANHQAQKLSLSSASHSSSGEDASQISLVRSPARLEKIIAIPAAHKGYDSPFMRAYPPSLEPHHLSRELFLKCIDDLNRIMIKSPPLAVLGLAGGIVGMVPSAICQIVGNSVNGAATLASIAYQRGRTEIYLRDINRTIFAPRGLKLELAKLEVLAKLAEIPCLASDGKVDKHKFLLPAFADIDEMRSLSAQQRRLNALQDYIAPLELEGLPDVQVPSNPVSKMNNYVADSNRKKGEKKIRKSRDKEYEKRLESLEKQEKAKDEYDAELMKLQRKVEKVQVKEANDPRKLERELAHLERERSKLDKELDKELSKADKTARKEERKQQEGKNKAKDSKEEKAFRQLLWVIVRPLEDVKTSSSAA